MFCGCGFQCMGVVEGVAYLYVRVLVGVAFGREGVVWVALWAWSYEL